MKPFNVSEDREQVGENGLKVVLSLGDDAPAELLFTNGKRKIEDVFTGEKDAVKAARHSFRDEELAKLIEQMTIRFGGQWGKRTTFHVKQFTNAEGTLTFDVNETREYPEPDVTIVSLELAENCPEDIAFSNWQRRVEQVIEREPDKAVHKRIRKMMRDQEFDHLKKRATTFLLGTDWKTFTRKIVMTISPK